LTGGRKAKIMKRLGNRDNRVATNLLRQCEYDRIRAQGGRSIGAPEPLGGESGGDAGERNSGPGYLSEQRSCAGGARTLLESAAGCGGKTFGVCGVSGEKSEEVSRQGSASADGEFTPFFQKTSQLQDLFRSGDILDPGERRDEGRDASTVVDLHFTKLNPRSARQGGGNIGKPNPLQIAFQNQGTWRKLVVGVWVGSALLLSGCAHKQTPVTVPPAPSISTEKPTTTTEPTTHKDERAEKIEVPADAKPIFEQVGIASWYGAPYHNRRGSNGEVYDMNAMTAAHLTLPLGSIVRVTNVRTGHSAVVRITDRGPFIEGRMLDLSLAAAKALDVYLPGTARVRMEVLEAPSALDAGGRWAVQIGSFPDQHNAADLADHLQRRYQTARVLKFASPTGDWWVRVRVRDDDRERAEGVMREMANSEAPAFLVRLD
jgi:rare lipoprotein A